MASHIRARVQQYEVFPCINIVTALHALSMRCTQPDKQTRIGHEARPKLFDNERKRAETKSAGATSSRRSGRSRCVRIGQADRDLSG